MQFSERELEDWFYKNPNSFVDATGCNCGDFYWIGRQVAVPSGIIDLLGICECRGTYPTLYVVELKAEKLRSSAIGQVVRYGYDIGVAVDKVAEYGICRVSRWCVGVGKIDDAVQYEANALNVRLLTVHPSFAIRGPWQWTESKIASDTKQLEGLGIQLRSHVLRACLNRETAENAQGTEEVAGEVVDS